MSKMRLLGVALGIPMMLYGVYTMAFDGEASGFVPVSGGIVIVALAMGVFDKNRQATEGDK